MDHRRDKRITLPPGLFSLAFVVLGFCEAPAQSDQSNTSHFLGGYGLAACRSLAPWCLTTILTLSMQLLAPASLTPTSISSETHKTWSPISSCTPFCFALTDRPEWVTRWQQQSQKICSKWLLAGFTTSLFVSPEMLPPYCLVPRKLNWGRWLAGVTLNPREESVLSFTVLGVSPPSRPAPIFYISSRAWHLSPSSATAFCMVCGGNCTLFCASDSPLLGELIAHYHNPDKSCLAALQEKICQLLNEESPLSGTHHEQKGPDCAERPMGLRSTVEICRGLLPWFRKVKVGTVWIIQTSRNDKICIIQTCIH